MTGHLGDYMPLKGAEKWSRDHHEIEKLHIDTRRKFTDSKNLILFELGRKLTKLSRKTVSEQ